MLRGDLGELDELCNVVLRELATCKPKLSREITRLTKCDRVQALTPLLRKIYKLRVLAEKDRAFLDGVLADLNASDRRGPRSPPNFIDIAERMLPAFHFRGELTGGNFRDI